MTGEGRYNFRAEEKLLNDWHNSMKQSQKDHSEDALLASVPKHIMTMAGFPSVGKTSICRAIRNDMKFDPEEGPTPAGMCMQSIGPFGPDKKKVQLWDISGKVHGEDEFMFVTGTWGKGKGPQFRPGRLIFRQQMRKQMMRRNDNIDPFYRIDSVSVTVIVYDASNRDSFHCTEPGKETDMTTFFRWAKYAQGEGALVALVANKCDLPNQVPPEEGQALVDEWNAQFPDSPDCCSFHEVSAKDGSGIKELKESLGNKLVQNEVGGPYKKWFPWQEAYIQLLEDGYEPRDAEHLLIDEEGNMEEVVRLMHDETDIESRIGLY